MARGSAGKAGADKAPEKHEDDGVVKHMGVTVLIAACKFDAFSSAAGASLPLSRYKNAPERNGGVRVSAADDDGGPSSTPDRACAGGGARCAGRRSRLAQCGVGD